MTQAMDGRRKHKELLGGHGMKFSTKMKGRIPAALVDYLLQEGIYATQAPPVVEKVVETPVSSDSESVEEEPEIMLIRDRMRKERSEYTEKGCKKCKQDLQLTMGIWVRFSDGQQQRLRILIDTGAQANLVRQDLLPPQYEYPAGKKLYFITANGQPLEGGDRCVSVDLAFTKVFEGAICNDDYWTNGE
jgi:hypothetical protein